ncbi:hypothetical protein EDC04DRAFT_2706548 [Pisolithus marmoratus]|nr:hypothetical protein EDC04DRAFT_2706548 [Pisolithus marmoratus]
MDLGARTLTCCGYHLTNYDILTSIGPDHFRQVVHERDVHTGKSSVAGILAELEYTLFTTYADDP